MEYSLISGTRDITISVQSEQSGQMTMTLNEQSHHINLKGTMPHQIHLEMDGVKRTLYVFQTSEGVWVWGNGRARLVMDKQDQRVSGRTRLSEGSQTISPPMPAVVMQVLVTVGQEVTKGAAVVVVSAMKMEMTLKAPYAGTVTAIHVKDGDNVNPSDVLVDITPLESDE